MLRASFTARALSHFPRLLRVTWGDGAESTYPSSWLRASVRDSKFFDGSCEYHPEHFTFVRKGLPIVAADHTGDGKEEYIRVQWEDHSTSFSVPWLRVQDAQNLKDLVKPVVEEALWTSGNELPQYEFSAKEECFESWMNDLRKWGVICVHGCPRTEKGVVDFLTMIAPLWLRSYHPTGATVVHLQATPKSKSIQLVYAVKDLEMHTDYLDYFPSPKIAGLLCTELNAPKLDTKTFVADGFKVLQDLRQEDPETFHVLSTTPLRRGRHRLVIEEECDPSEVWMYQRNFIMEDPVVCMEGNKIKRIQIRRGKDVGLSLGVGHDDECVRRFYDAYGKLAALISDPKYTQGFVLKPGMMLVFDNDRVCHGRSEIHPSTHRVGKSAYIVEEGWRNRWRLLLGQRSGLDAKWLYGCSDEALAVLAQRNEDLK